MIGSHLREEHGELRVHINRIREAADAIGRKFTDDIHEGVESALLFLRTQLLPHAEVEEKALYPAVAKVLGDARSTETMSEDHRAIGAYVEELSRLNKHHADDSIGLSPLADLRRVLYSLSAIITLHLEKEERVYIPLLESRFNEQQNRELLEAVEKAAEDIFSTTEGENDENTNKE